MRLHRNAKLGLAGRFALVQARERGCRSGRWRDAQRLAGDGLPLGRRGGGGRAGARRRSRACSTARAGRGGCRGCCRRASSADLRGPAAHRLGPAASGRADRPSARDDLEGAAPARALAPARRAARARPPLRVALPRRSAAHGLESYARFDASRPRRHRRPQLDRAEKRARVGYEYAHAIVDDHSRLAYAESLADERPPTVTPSSRALAFFAEHRIEPERLMTDNAWSYTHNRSLRELLASARSGTSHAQAPPAAEREGRALPPDDGARMGLRPPLPLLSTPRRALPHWLAYYNHRRPHSSLGGRPPISRVHNLCRQDS